MRLVYGMSLPSLFVDESDARSLCVEIWLMWEALEENRLANMKLGLIVYLHICKGRALWWSSLKRVLRISYSKILPVSNVTVIRKLCFSRQTLKWCQRLAGFEAHWELFITPCGYLLVLECAKWFLETHTEPSEDCHIWCRFFML